MHTKIIIDFLSRYLALCSLFALLACEPMAHGSYDKAECEHHSHCPSGELCVDSRCEPACMAHGICGNDGVEADAGEGDAARENDRGGVVDADFSLDAGSAPDMGRGDDAASTGISCSDAPCFPGVVCTDLALESGDRFVCGNCPAGYTGDGVSCTDVDGCAAAPCYPGVACSDVAADQEATVGAAFTCASCPAGYQGDGVICTASPPDDCTLWDYSANAPCPSGIYNCDCEAGCGSTSCGTDPPDPDPDDCTLWDYSNDAPCLSGTYNCDCSAGCGGTTPCGENPPTGTYETRFHHTATGSSDGGKSLVLCPGQTMNFDSCSSNGVNIPWHGYDNGRETYWNMHAEPDGDIVCRKGGSEYRYKADRTFVWGDC